MRPPLLEDLKRQEREKREQFENEFVVTPDNTSIPALNITSDIVPDIVPDIIPDIVPFMVLIPTYNRPQLMLNLLKQLYQKNDADLFYVSILDDCSTEQYWDVLEFLQGKKNFKFIINERNYGKKEYWKTVSELFSCAEITKTKYVIYLDDDAVLVDNFFERCLESWNNFPQLIDVMNLNPDRSNLFGLDNWIDSFFMCKWEILEELNFMVHAIDKKRWVESRKQRCSGVWEQLSHRLTNKGKFIYSCNKQLAKRAPNTLTQLHRKKSFEVPVNNEKEIKLHIGCGGVRYEGYVNIDIKPTKAVDKIADCKSITYDDNSVTKIISFHLIEHLSRNDCIEVLKRWYRSLKPDGEIVIECPDFEGTVQKFIKGDLTMINNIYGLQRDKHDFHYWGYTKKSLSKLLNEIGFKNIKVGNGTDYHALEEPCLRIEATK